MEKKTTEFYHEYILKNNVKEISFLFITFVNFFSSTTSTHNYGGRKLYNIKKTETQKMFFAL